MIRKLAVIGLLLACLPGPSHATTKHKQFEVHDFSKGLDTYHNPSTLPDGFVQDGLNVLYDDVAPITKRAGYTTAWSTTTGFAFTGLWTYTDQSNTTWQIARSSTQITASNLGGSVVKITTVAASNFVGETNAFGNAYFVDQTQGLYYWNGTSTTYVVGSPKGSIIAQFHNRLWIAGAAVPNGNQLYGSAYYAGNTWTTGVNATDPVQYSIGLQDNFDNITAEYVYLDTLYLFKHYSIFALYGFDQTNFQISQLTQECGCIDGGSIQTYNGGLKFMSLRGVENFNGYICTRISDSVKNKVDPAIQIGSFSQQSWIQQNATDWNAGTFNPTANLNSAVVAPALVLSTGTKTDSAAADFNLGSNSNTTVGANSVFISTNNSGSIDDPSFEGSLGTNYNYSGFAQYASSGSVNPQSGSYFVSACGAACYGLVKVSDRNTGATLASASLGTCYSMSGLGWQLGTVSLSATRPPIGDRIIVTFCMSVDGTSCTKYIQTANTYVAGGSVSFYYRGDNKAAGSCGGLVSPPEGQTSISYDNVSGGSSTITTGSFTSQVTDTGITKNYASLGTFTTNNNTSTPTVVLQSSSDNVFWQNLGTSTGTSYLANRYIRYITTFTINSSDYGLSNLSNATFQWTASSGAFKSQIHTIGAINSWGNFTVSQVLNGGAIVYSICSSTNSNMSAPNSCVGQTANSQITVSTGVTGNSLYAQWYSTFSVTAATQTPTLNSGAVAWFTGSNAVPMSSTVWDNRYWLSLTTTTTDSVNDAVLVLNSKGAWTIFDIRAGAFAQYKNSLYHADSNASGNIYLDNQGYADNGSAMRAFVNTKNESLGTLAADDYLYTLYLEAANTGSCTMTVQYALDGSTSTLSLGSPTLNEYATVSSVRLPFPVDSSHQDFGQSIDFTIGTNDSSCGWQFYGLTGLHKTRPVQ